LQSWGNKKDETTKLLQTLLDIKLPCWTFQAWSEPQLDTSYDFAQKSRNRVVERDIVPEASNVGKSCCHLFLEIMMRELDTQVVPLHLPVSCDGPSIIGGFLSCKLWDAKSRKAHFAGYDM